MAADKLCCEANKSKVVFAELYVLALFFDTDFWTSRVDSALKFATLMGECCLRPVEHVGILP